MHKIKAGGKCKKQDDHKGKGTCNKQKIFLCAGCMMNTQRSFHFEKPYFCDAANLFRYICIAGYCCYWRNPCCLLRRGMGGNEYSDNTNGSAAENTAYAYCKKRHIHPLAFYQNF